MLVEYRRGTNLSSLLELTSWVATWYSTVWLQRGRRQLITLKGEIMIMGMLPIGNGEKCPFCEMLMTKDIRIFDHIFSNHKEQLIENLFVKEEGHES